MDGKARLLQREVQASQLNRFHREGGQDGVVELFAIGLGQPVALIRSNSMNRNI